MKRGVLSGVTIGILLLLIIGWVLFQISKSRTFQFFGGITNRVNTSEKVVALTFDDAPTNETENVLGVLREKQVKATIYVVGERIRQYSQEMRAIVKDGHEVGNHSLTHQRFLLKSFAFIDKEIQETNTLIREAGYTGPITFRPPNGKKLVLLPWYLHTHNIRTVTWDVEPDSYIPKSITSAGKTDFLITYIRDYVQPGSIILLHPFCPSCGSDRNALPAIIDMLRSSGYRFVTVSELLSHQKP